MIKVGEKYKPNNAWNGEYLCISSYKPHESEVRNYGVKRTYYVHAVYKNTSVFVGRFFKLKKARKAVSNYFMMI